MPIVMYYSKYDFTAVSSFAYLVVVTIAHTATPIFTMIMGALLLNKNEKTIYIIRHRIIKIILIILSLSVYYLIDDAVCEHIFKPHRLIYSFFDLTGRDLIYWYLYWWLTVVLLLPFLQATSKKIAKNFKYVLCIYFITIIIPIINIVINKIGANGIIISKYLDLTFISNNFIYLYCGYYLQNVLHNKYFDIIKNSHLIFAFIMLLLFAVFVERIGTGIYNHQANIVTPFLAIVIYIFIKKNQDLKNLNNTNVKSKVNELISFIAKTSFGIYILQPIFFNKTRACFTDFVKAKVCELLLKLHDFDVYSLDFEYLSVFIASIIYLIICLISLALIISLVKKLINVFNNYNKVLV